MIQCVLSTDMSRHSLSIQFLKKCLTENNKPEDNDKQDYMDLVIHTADISNPTKIFDIYFKWAKLVVEEFYYQGDKEKNLGLKCSCDRNKVTLYKNQIGFIDFIEGSNGNIKKINNKFLKQGLICVASLALLLLIGRLLFLKIRFKP